MVQIDEHEINDYIYKIIQVIHSEPDTAEELLRQLSSMIIHSRPATDTTKNLPKTTISQRL